jgi:hypothetical protein
MRGLGSPLPCHGSKRRVRIPYAPPQVEMSVRVRPGGKAPRDTAAAVDSKVSTPCGAMGSTPPLVWEVTHPYNCVGLANLTDLKEGVVAPADP